MTTKKAIILSYNHSITELEQLALPLTISCQEHNLDLIRIIKATGTYDSKAIQQLIKEVINQGTPVTVITDMNTYTSNIHIPTWCVLGTLLAAGLADRFMLYSLENSGQQDNNKIAIFEMLEGKKHALLDLSFLHFEMFAQWQKQKEQVAINQN